MTVGEKLRKLRGDRPRKEVVAEVGISLSTLEMYELDQRTPQDAIKARLARYYGVRVGALFFGEDDDSII